MAKVARQSSDLFSGTREQRQWQFMNISKPIQRQERSFKRTVRSNAMQNRQRTKHGAFGVLLQVTSVVSSSGQTSHIASSDKGEATEDAAIKSKCHKGVALKVITRWSRMCRHPIHKQPAWESLVSVEPASRAKAESNKRMANMSSSSAVTRDDRSVSKICRISMRQHSTLGPQKLFATARFDYPNTLRPQIQDLLPHCR